MALPDCTEAELQAIYEWVDSVPLSRPKRNIARDFADGGGCPARRQGLLSGVRLGACAHAPFCNGLNLASACPPLPQC